MHCMEINYSLTTVFRARENMILFRYNDNLKQIVWQ